MYSMGNLSLPEKTELTIKKDSTQYSPMIEYKRENPPARIKRERNIISNFDRFHYS